MGRAARAAATTPASGETSSPPAVDAYRPPPAPWPAGESAWVRAEEAVRKAYLPVLWLGGAAAGVVLSAFGMGDAAAAVVIPSWSAAIGLGVADAIKNPID